MTLVTNIEMLEALYDAPLPKALTKVSEFVTPCYKKWIESSKFLVLSSVGPEGTDASPRGDDGAVVVVYNPRTILLPDWQGNNRLDSLRNIVNDGRVSLMFMIPGCNNVVRANGHATLTVNPETIRQFSKAGKSPNTVVIIDVKEIYFQCAKALMRSNLWNSSDESKDIPTAGQFIKERDTDFDSDTYDSNYAENVKEKMW